MTKIELLKAFAKGWFGNSQQHSIHAQLLKARGLNKLADKIMAESDEEFLDIQERVLAELADLGEADVWTWFNDQWEAAREMIWPIFEQSCLEQGLRPEGVRDINDYNY